MADTPDTERPAEPPRSEALTASELPGLPEMSPSMLDVHPPHEILHSWKAFFIHIATIVVGLFIAVALEQTVEAVHRHRELAALREDLHAETRQIIADARGSAAAHLYEIHWLEGRITQVQVAIREHSVIANRQINDMPNYASPDIPIWRSAKAGGRTTLLTKGEVNAYAEIEYVQAHLDELEIAKNGARYAVRSFNRRFPALPNGDPDLAMASVEDLRNYLPLLTTAYEAIDAYVHWLRITIGAASAVADGKTRLEEIYASERRSAGTEFFHNFM